MRYHYVWLLWSGAFLAVWLALYLARPAMRREMLRVSAATSVLGLTEPIFVPEYWSPPSLFELASRTGFDIESLIFCFAIGGIGSLAYNALSPRELRAVPDAERRIGRHHLHRLALAVPFVIFPPLYALSWNPIYPGIVALAAGAATNVLCRPDLGRKTLLGGALFFVLYGVFVLLLVVFAPGYIEQVWNLPALSGVRIAGVPLEELAFGFAFGMYWAGVYEHFAWKQAATEEGPHDRPLARQPHTR